MKSEFLHQYQQKHGVSRRARLLAHADRVARWGSRLAPWSNLVLGNSIVRWLNEKLVGLDRRRQPPTFARQTFLQWWAKRDHEREAPTVAFFADTFTNYYEPEHAIAAVRVAEALGAQATVPHRVCCGRPLISKGLLDEARAQAEATTAALAPLAQQGLPIVFCEPSCYSAVRDDHPHLLRGEAKRQAEMVADACTTFEEWAASGVRRASRPTVSRDGRRTGHGVTGPHSILFHGHCHQKALVGTGPAVDLLAAIPGSQVTDLDSGCCGMAGSFGYEREHYDVSQAVGERRLFPAIRDRPPETLVVAPGFSCRHQIRHFTGVEAVSTATLLERMLG